VILGAILGTALKLEQDAVMLGSKSGGVAPVSAVRQAMMGPLAALGDVFFWATLRPLAAMAGVGVYFLGGAHALTSLAACLALLIVFNGPHLLARYRGPRLGFKHGSEMIALLRQVDVPRSIARAHRVGLVVLAALVAGLGRFRFPGVAEAPLGDNLLFLGAGALMLVALRFKVSAFKVLLLLLGMALLAASLEPVTAMGN
jgi:mannose/fructose/N-acetylgalactosamine-specific phosphotransferase system component IID